MNAKYRLSASLAIFALSAAATAQVQEAWIVRYTGPLQLNNDGRAMALDHEGNIHVAGRAYTTPFGSSEFVTLRYDSNGVLQWARHYGEAQGGDGARAIAVDTAGNVYVTGEEYLSLSNSRFATIKYAPDGSMVWTRHYQGPGDGSDVPFAIATDAQGNVYVTGQSARDGSGGTPPLDVATIKYDPQGNELWVRRYNGGSANIPAAMAVDSAGNVYITGRTQIPLSFATVKYDTNGNQIWARHWRGAPTGSNDPSDIAVDASGNVYVTGRADTGASRPYATIKYDAAGNELWVRHYVGPGSGFHSARAIALDSAGNAYVTGGSPAGSAGTSNDYATVKYDPEGNEIWVRRYSGPGGAADNATAIAVDITGNVYITGRSSGNGTGSDYATVKYDPAGNQMWVARYDGPASGADRAWALAVDEFGSVFVTGASQGVATALDIVTIKYVQDPVCYANCDNSTTEPILNVDDFTCFINSFAEAMGLPHQAQIGHYANCDGSTTAPVLNVDDFTCFINAFAQGCS